ncbi:hypothetical protein DEU56DRAFT_745106, partial [Suillus clintonianus]|uniref:uncharacterized protein n=1 Tax=Suillus clintonianus TaxID=1904413 RepID=UPI001B877204
QVRPHLTQAVLAEFELKAQEFGTMKRVYCVAPTCSRFLGPLHEGYFTKVFTCTSPTCTMTTCGKCCSRHEGFTHICTPDADAEQILTLSRTSGWARCPGCAQMIELDMGCFHMTCRCRTEFCYLCKELWKNCGCPQWDEARLLATAERRVDAQLPPAQPANPFRQAPAVRQPVPAVGDVRNQPVYLPRQAPVPALVPAPVANIRPANPFQQVPAPAPGAAPLPVPLRPTILRPEAPVPAPLPAPHFVSGTRRAETNDRSAATAASPGSDRNAVRQRMIRETMERLRVDHDCDHTNWTFRIGGGRCEACETHLPLYLFRCRGCEMLACNRCRRNRL